jgi:PadR family transcriptional regulator, regulatory protein PadR
MSAANSYVAAANDVGRRAKRPMWTGEMGFAAVGGAWNAGPPLTDGAASLDLLGGAMQNLLMPMGKTVRITDNVVAVFNQMLHPVSKPWYGLELAEAAEIGSATIYAVLTRLERAGLVNGSWETGDPKVLGRPQRRLYTLTPDGARVGNEAIASYRPRVVLKRTPPGWLPGLVPKAHTK